MSKPMVGAMNRSMAAMSGAWLRRKARHPGEGRAIAYGKAAPILHLAGWIGSERQLSRSALDSVLFWVRFGGRVSTARRLALDPGEYNRGKAICDSPTHKGEGSSPNACHRFRSISLARSFMCRLLLAAL